MNLSTKESFWDIVLNVFRFYLQPDAGSVDSHAVPAEVQYFLFDFGFMNTLFIFWGFFLLLFLQTHEIRTKVPMLLIYKLFSKRMLDFPIDFSHDAIQIFLVPHLQFLVMATTLVRSSPFQNFA